jgi:hypothetical protein
MTEREEQLEELLQDPEPASIGRVIELLDKCCADLGKVMEARQIVPSIHTKNLVYGLGQSRTMLRQVYQDLQAIYYPQKTNE